MGPGLSRRSFHALSLALLSGVATGEFGCARRSERPGGRVLVFGQALEPTGLNSAISTAAPATFAAAKIFDPLVGYSPTGEPTPKLALRWDAAADGLSYRFNLRPGVRWHDGQPLTSDDVAFSLLDVWKKYHARGRTTFANVSAVETPDPHTAILRLSAPAPYLMKCLAVTEATVIPKHLYASGDVLSNPHNVAPVGNGPFRFQRWDRGDKIVLERNPDYWDASEPHIDGVVVRFLPDATAAAIALETGDIDLAYNVPFSQIGRLQANSRLQVLIETASLSPGWLQAEFNLDKPPFGDVRVRQAIACAIDRAFIARNIVGDGQPADSPIPAELKEFHTDDVPQYPLDFERAASLLDRAGLKPDAQGVRLTATLDYAASEQNTRIAAHMRSTLSKVGVLIEARSQDQAEYINRVYTRRDYELCMTGSGAGLDPAIGVQRYYWSKNIRSGVAFSNGAHYRNPQVDRLLEQAQVEIDPEKRKALYATFQKIAMTDLPYIPLVYTRAFIVASKRVVGLNAEMGGVNTDFSGLTLTA
jgi:peptide/nickel transport system substrate-binding protein